MTEVCDAYTSATLFAKKEIVIVGSYFLYRRSLVQALKKPGKKGIKMTVILAGIRDVPMFRRAATHLYSSFICHNITVYEWNKSVAHGKAAIVDDECSTIGSFNLNSLSCYGSIEMNVEVCTSDLAHLLLSSKDNYRLLLKLFGLEDLYKKVLNKLNSVLTGEISKIEVITYITIYNVMK